MHQKIKINKLLILVFLLTSFFYFFKLGTIPTSVHGDEAETALQAIEILRGNVGLIGVGWFDVPLLSFAPHAFFMKIFGENVIANRLASVFFGLAILPFYFLLGRDLINVRVALISSVLLSTSHLWLALSRTGMHYTQAGFLVVVSAYLTITAFSKKNRFIFFAAGISAGLGFYSYFAARSALFLSVIIFATNFEKPNFRKWFYSLIFFTIGFTLTLMPQLSYYVQNPRSFSSRENTVSVFNEVGKKWSGYQGMSNFEILATQTEKTLNIFRGDNSTQYGYKGKLLDYFTLIFLFLGFVFLRKYKKSAILILGWVFISLIGQIFTTIPPPFFLPRFTVGIPVLFLIIGLGFVSFYEIVNKKIKTKTILKIIYFFIFLTIIIWNLKTYFYVYLNQPAGDKNARAATKIAEFLENVPDNYTVFLHSKPYLYPDFGTFRFLLSDRKILDGENKNNYPKSVIIAYPHYLNEIIKIGKPTEISEFKDVDGSILFYSIIID